ncbi:hypothetical protein [Streptomyces sp. AC495_CC817]|uniref:hypothetical protein n=1 Tax=Streptomyces sp. AC495_CC817 TaxID=2823900 RepID=UPI001C267AC3|nr:hypothetical protein [Streptomyces sp. AC495_CC817]
MSFFPPDPDLPPEPEEVESSSPPWWGAPDDELPALLPVAEILARTEHVALALVGVAVHRSGVEFRLTGRLRRRGLPAREWNDLCAAFVGHHPHGPIDDARDRLRYGVELSDGERVFADHFFAVPDPSQEPGGHVLSRRGGSSGGGSRTYTSDDQLWLWPLPPAGPIDLVMQWPALGIGERRVRLDGAAMLALVDRVGSFWP